MVKLESHQFASLACQSIKTLESIIKWQEHSGNQSVSLMIGAGIFCGHRLAKPSAVSMGRKSTSSKGLLLVACRERKLLAPVVRKVDSAIHWINYYPLNSAIGFPNSGAPRARGRSPIPK